MSAIIVVDAFWGDSVKARSPPSSRKNTKPPTASEPGSAPTPGTVSSLPTAAKSALGSYPAAFSIPIRNCASAAASPSIPSSFSPN